MLSTGLERLMKLALCLAEYEKSGKYLSKKQMKDDLGHGLKKLNSHVVKACFTPTYLNRPFAKADQGFLSSDVDAKCLFEILNDFATRDRYRFMDQISEKSIDFVRDDPKSRWEGFEKQLLTEKIYLALMDANYQELKRQSNIKAKAIIERITRALSRLFFYGALGDMGRTQYVLVSGFARLEDDHLGQTVYTL